VIVPVIVPVIVQASLACHRQLENAHFWHFLWPHLFPLFFFFAAFLLREAVSSKFTELHLQLGVFALI
jgi:hypothetical protein